MELQKIDEPNNNHGLKGPALFNEHRKDKDILYSMNEDTYEEMIASWAYYCLKEDGSKRYQDVLRLGGAGDGGMDVVAFYDQATRKCDIYQCKHYDSPINKSAVIAELGKFLYHVYTGLLPNPDKYYLMAPKGLSAPFTLIYTNADKLKQTIISEWDDSIADHIEKNKSYKKAGGLEAFLNSFDYTKFNVYSSDRLIEDLLGAGHRHVYTQYFGVRKDTINCEKIPTPTECTDYESHYIDYLIDAYNDSVVDKAVSVENVEETRFAKHFARSRDEFWLAESIRKMSVENCPGDIDEFSELETDMYHHVADVHEEDYDNAFERVKAVTNQATSLPKKEQSIISGQLGARELKGVCFQLSNEDKLIWKEK